MASTTSRPTRPGSASAPTTTRPPSPSRASAAGGRAWAGPPTHRTGRAKPLVSHEVVVNLIAATTTRTGLTVRSELDTGDYPAGLRVSDAGMRGLPLRR